MRERRKRNYSSKYRHITKRFCIYWLCMDSHSLQLNGKCVYVYVWNVAVSCRVFNVYQFFSNSFSDAVTLAGRILLQHSLSFSRSSLISCCSNYLLSTIPDIFFAQIYLKFFYLFSVLNIYLSNVCMQSCGIVWTSRMCLSLFSLFLSQSLNHFYSSSIFLVVKYFLFVLQLLALLFSSCLLLSQSVFRWQFEIADSFIRIFFVLSIAIIPYYHPLLLSTVPYK